MKKQLYIITLLLCTTAIVASGIYVLPDDVYSTKQENTITYVETTSVDETVAPEIEETYPEEVTIHQPDGETNDILIADPTLDTYTEGFMVYKNEDGTNDTIYVYGDPEDYIQSSEIDTTKISQQ